MSTRLPDPIANTTTEAYLAYKAGVLQKSELKDSLYYPTDHFDAWLARWSGLLYDYPKKGVGKNLFNAFDKPAQENRASYTAHDNMVYIKDEQGSTYDYCQWRFNNLIPGKKYTVSCSSIVSSSGDPTGRVLYVNGLKTDGTTIGVGGVNYPTLKYTFTVPEDVRWIGVSLYGRDNNTYAYSDVMLEMGDDASEYEPYSGEPEMLCDEEAIVAHLAGVTDTYPQEVKDPYDIRITEYLKHLVSIRWHRPEYPVNNQELYLSMITPHEKTNDTPGSALYFTGTAEGPFIDYKLFGNTEQAQYTGKNICDYKPKDEPNHGIYSTYDKATGIIHIWGTTDATWADIGQIIERTVAADTQVTAWAEVLEGSFSGKFAYRTSVPSGSGGHTTKDTLYFYPGKNNKQTKTLAAASEYRVYITELTAETQLDFTARVMVEAGGSVTSFEPYVGEKPAPNKDYNYPIKSVVGEQKVTVCGKNILSSTWEDGQLNQNTGRKEPGNAYRTKDYIIVEPNANYRVSRDGSALAMNFCEYDKDKNFIRYIYRSQSQTLTTTENTRYILMSRGTSVTMDKAMLEKGTTVSAYEPYSKKQFTINLPDNPNLYDVTQAYVVENSSTSFDIRLNVDIVPGKEYVYETDRPWTRARLYNSDGEVTRTFGDTSTTYEVVFTPEEGEVTAVLSFYAGNTRPDLSTYDFIDVEFGEYPLKEELCWLANFEDKIYRYDGDWYIRKEVNRQHFSGRENWYISGNSIKYSSNGGIAASTGYKQTGSLPMRCDFARCSDWAPVYANEGNTDLIALSSKTGGGGTNDLTVFLSLASFESVDSLKEYLSDGTHYMEYVMNTPIIAKIANQQLIDQLNELLELGSNEGVTYITVEPVNDNTLPALMQVEVGEYE